jgi:hypothetical protein
VYYVPLHVHFCFADGSAKCSLWFVKVDAFAEKNNMTEAVNVGKEFVRGFSLKEDSEGVGVQNQTEVTSLATPSHPLVEKLQNIKVRSFESYLAYWDGVFV